MVKKESIQAFEKLIRDSAPIAPLPEPDPLIERKMHELADKLSNSKNADGEGMLSCKPDDGI